MEEMKCPKPRLQGNALKGQTAHSPGQSEATPWVKGAHRLNIAL